MPAKPYAQPSPSLAFYTGSKKAAHYKVIRWLLSFAVEGSQSLLASVWTSLASCKSLSWTYFGHYIDFDFCGEFTFSWNLWNWLRSWTRDWIRYSTKKLFSRRALTVFITIYWQCKNIIHLLTLFWNNFLNLTFFLVIKQMANCRSYWETNNGFPGNGEGKIMVFWTGKVHDWQRVYSHGFQKRLIFSYDKVKT